MAYCINGRFRYIRQAAESGRLDEVRMLEQNLRELQKELENQRQQAKLSTVSSGGNSAVF